MAEKVKKPYARFRYTIDDLKAAVAEVVEGRLSATKASKQFRIPKGTLINKLHGKSDVETRKMGPPRILTSHEEDMLEEWILQKAKNGFPMHPDEVKDAVQKVMEETQRDNPFNNNRPGDKWLKGFLKAKPAIANRNAEIISKARACVTEKNIKRWFQDLKNYLEEEQSVDLLQDGDRIYNADETGLQLCPKTGKVLGPKLFKNFYDIAVGKEKECLTVLANFSASGKVAPTLIIYPYKRIPRDIAASMPEKFCIGRSDSGWMVGPTFYEYVVNNFYPWLISNNVKFPILFILDGHKSHISYELATFCREKRIFLYCLLPNATHILQPCDVGIFRPLKVSWRKQCQLFKQQTRKSLTKVIFAPIFEKAFNQACKQETIQNAFRACGLFPFNVDNVDFSKCMNTRLITFPNNQVNINLNDDTTETDKMDKIKFLKMLENEISPQTLGKYRNQKNLQEVMKNDKLFQIWSKYASTVNENEDDRDEERIIDNTHEDNVLINENSEVILVHAMVHENVDNEITHTEDDRGVRNEERIENIIDTYEDIEKETPLSINQTTEVILVHAMVHKIADEDSTRTQEKKINLKDKDNENINQEDNKNFIGPQISKVAESPQKNNNSEQVKGLVCKELKKTSTDGNLNGDKSLDEIWKQYLHLPKMEVATTKKILKEKAPLALAISSNYWIEYYEKKDEEKKNEEKQKEQRKLVRQEKKRKREEMQKNKESLKETKSLKKKKVSTSSSSSEDNSDLDYTEYEQEENPEAISDSTLNLRSTTGKTTLTVADFVIVRYEEKYFPGIIVKKQFREYEVRVMCKSGLQTWKYPDKVDQIWYKEEDVLQKIEPPAIIGSRGNTYSVPEMNKYDNISVPN